MFIDENSKIDREALREHTLQELTRLKEVSGQLTRDSKNEAFWKSIQDTVAVLELDENTRNNYKNLLQEFQNLNKYIDKWITTTVDNPNRFEFFIASKAEEISSGDEEKDYFWALQIRHDQLIAVIRVISRLLEIITTWVSQDPKTVLDDPLFQGLIDTSLEEQIYLEAENIHKQRDQHL